MNAYLTASTSHGIHDLNLVKKIQSSNWGEESHFDLPSVAPPAEPSGPSSGRLFNSWMTRRIKLVIQSGKLPVESYFVLEPGNRAVKKICTRSSASSSSSVSLDTKSVKGPFRSSKENDGKAMSWPEGSVGSESSAEGGPSTVKSPNLMNCDISTRKAVVQS